MGGAQIETATQRERWKKHSAPAGESYLLLRVPSGCSLWLLKALVSLSRSLALSCSFSGEKKLPRRPVPRRAPAASSESEMA